jgi:hypothetical protein
MLIVVALLAGPVLWAGHGRRLRAAGLVVSFYPVLLVCSLYATWFTAWYVLGHRPRSSLDDPKYISPVVLVPYFTTCVLIVGIPFGLLAWIALLRASFIQNLRPDRFRPVRAAADALISAVSWLSVLFICVWNMLGIGTILEWFMD